MSVIARWLGVAFLLPTAASAQSQDALFDLSLDDLLKVSIVSGRAGERSAIATALPVDVISRQRLLESGEVETGRALQKLIPAFHFPQVYVADGTDLIWPAALRAMGPDQMLVLVNGKRRHQQALVNVQQTPGRGSAGTDINAIPLSAIERVEVLRDGASALYGSDAIAGVVNIVLRSAAEASEAAVDYRLSSRGDGETTTVSAGASLSSGSGALRLQVEHLDRGETNRAGVDSLRVSLPRVTQRLGDADVESLALIWNGEWSLGRSQLYLFGGVSNRRGNSSGFYRPAGDGRTIPQLYPDGFLPTLITESEDRAASFGWRRPLFSDWQMDLSVGWGHNRFQFGSRNSANVSWFYEPTEAGGIVGETPKAADDGALENRLALANWDIKGEVDWQWGKEPLFLAAGLEWRRDTYRIEAGDPVSYAYGRANDASIPILNQLGLPAAPGIQGFPGFTPATEVDRGRQGLSLYVDGESYIKTKWLAGGAIRFEHYSDTGSHLTGKLTTRYDFSPQSSLRSAVSTGVRAPGVQQANFSQVSTVLVNGVLTDTTTARERSPLAQALGLSPLREEDATQATLGWVYRPSRMTSLTVDLFAIDIADRIVLSGYITPDGADGCADVAVCPARVVLEQFNVSAANFFLNAVDTRTTGVDVVLDHRVDAASNGEWQWLLTYGYHRTEVREIRTQTDLLPPATLFDQSQVRLVETGSPRHRANLLAKYSADRWSLGARANYFGAVSANGFGPLYEDHGRWWLDLFAQASLGGGWQLQAGINNVFDVLQGRWENASPFDGLGFTRGWETLPVGVNGRQFFINLRWSRERNSAAL